MVHFMDIHSGYRGLLLKTFPQIKGEILKANCLEWFIIWFMSMEERLKSLHGKLNMQHIYDVVWIKFIPEHRGSNTCLSCKSQNNSMDQWSIFVLLVDKDMLTKKQIKLFLFDIEVQVMSTRGTITCNFTFPSFVSSPFYFFSEGDWAINLRKNGKLIWLRLRCSLQFSGPNAMLCGAPKSKLMYLFGLIVLGYHSFLVD